MVSSLALFRVMVSRGRWAKRVMSVRSGKPFPEPADSGLKNDHANAGTPQAIPGRPRMPTWISMSLAIMNGEPTVSRRPGRRPRAVRALLAERIPDAAEELFFRGMVCGDDG